MIEPAVGKKIVVYDSQNVELGEGTFLSRSLIADRGVTVYECVEHVILAKGQHFLKIDENIYTIRSGR